MRNPFRGVAFFCVLVVSFFCAANSAARTKKHPPAQPVNLNSATLNQLEELPGVGPVTAKAIVDFRTKSGPFRSVKDLLSIHGISEKRLEKLRPYVTVGPAEKLAPSRPQPNKSAATSH